MKLVAVVLLVAVLLHVTKYGYTSEECADSFIFPFTFANGLSVFQWLRPTPWRLRKNARGQGIAVPFDLSRTYPSVLV